MMIVIWERYKRAKEHKNVFVYRQNGTSENREKRWKVRLLMFVVVISTTKTQNIAYNIFFSNDLTTPHETINFQLSNAIPLIWHGNDGDGRGKISSIHIAWGRHRRRLEGWYENNFKKIHSLRMTRQFIWKSLWIRRVSYNIFDEKHFQEKISSYKWNGM